MTGGFPFFRVAGDPDQIGAQCGALFGDRIRACVSFYVELLAEVLEREISRDFARNDFLSNLREWTAPFEDSIRTYLPRIAIEIDAMAKGSGLDPWQLYFINSRTELYGIAAQKKKVPTLTAPSECTSLFMRGERLLGENWDWHPRVEDLSIVLEVAPSEGPRFVMLTEPGIVGKIGLNEHGLGLCLNILFADISFTGVPVHAMLRAILESRNVQSAHELIKNLPRGTASNLLFADPTGSFRNLEMRGAELREVFTEDPVILHTNHYVGEEEQIRESNPSSYARFKRGREVYPQIAGKGLEGFKRLLSDTEDDNFPICRSYKQGVSFMVGTVAGVILELEKRRIHVVKGRSHADSTWHEYSL